MNAQDLSWRPHFWLRSLLEPEASQIELKPYVRNIVRCYILLKIVLRASDVSMRPLHKKQVVRWNRDSTQDPLAQSAETKWSKVSKHVRRSSSACVETLDWLAVAMGRQTYEVLQVGCWRGSTIRVDVFSRSQMHRYNQSTCSNGENS
jgi:hypothetical protein